MADIDLYTKDIHNNDKRIIQKYDLEDLGVRRYPIFLGFSKKQVFISTLSYVSFRTFDMKESPFYQTKRICLRCLLDYPEDSECEENIAYIVKHPEIDKAVFDILRDNKITRYNE